MKNRRKCLIALSLLASAWPLAAQSVPSPRAGTGPGNDGEVPDAVAAEAVVLSPFIVNSDRDTGYLASQTLSGTRLATDLKDAPSPVTVLTKDFLLDIDAVDINQALSFLPSVDQDPRAYNSLNNNPVNSRVRGFEQTNNNVNFFASRITTDRYNIDRIEINRGPNAILFGIGNPGGTYVATTKNALLTRNFGSIENRIDTLDSWRFTGDWNQVLVKNRLAVRFAGLTEDQRGFISPASDREERFYGALNADVVNTVNYDLKLRYQFENHTQLNVLASWNPPGDNVTAWQDAGSPLYNLATEVPLNLRWPLGMSGMPNGQTITEVVGGSLGQVPTFIYGNRPTSALSASASGQRYRIGTPQSRALIPGTTQLVPNDISYSGTTSGFSSDAQSHTAFVEQVFFGKLYTEFAYYLQREDRDWNRSTGGGDIYVDVLRLLPNGAANPNVGQLFTQGTLRVQRQFREIESARMTMGYELDLAKNKKWLGRHRFGVLLERSRDLLGLNDFVDVNLRTDRAGAFQTDLTNAGNRVIRRSYLFTGQANYWMAQASPSLNTFVPISGVVDLNSVQSERGDPYESAMVNSRVARSESEVDSWVLSMQSFFPAPGFGKIEDRLVPFWGVRGDDQVSTELDGVAAQASRVRGVFPDWRTLPYAVSQTFKDSTLTWGSVYRLTPAIDLFYNNSEVLSPGTSRRDVFGESVPSSTGEGWDGGVRVSLLQGKLQGGISVFEAKQVNIALFNVISGTLGGQNATPINDLLDALTAIKISGSGPAGFPNLNYEAAKINVPDPVDTYDNVSKGVDLEITYNPSPNWRISLRGQRIVDQQSNVLNRSFRHYTEFLLPIEAAFASAGLTNYAIPNYSRDIARFFADTRQEIASDKLSREGVVGARSSKWRGTLVTNYRFTSGLLKNFSVGANLRYASPRAVQPLIDSLTGFTGVYVRDKADYNLGADVGYRRKISPRVVMNLRVHVTNLLDLDDPVIQNANPTSGEIFALRQVQGREAALTTSFEF